MFLGTPTSPPPTRRLVSQLQNATALKLLFLGCFEAAVAKSRNDSVAADMLENGALLYAFFIVFPAVMARVFACDLLHMSVVPQNFRFDGNFL